MQINILEALWPLHVACANGDLGAVKALLKNMDEEDISRRVNETLPGGATALHVLFHCMGENYAIHGGKKSADYFAVLSYMLSRGARLDVEDAEERRPAAMLRGQTPPAVQRLLEAQQVILAVEEEEEVKKREEKWRAKNSRRETGIAYKRGHDWQTRKPEVKHKVRAKVTANPSQQQPSVV